MGAILSVLLRVLTLVGLGVKRAGLGALSALVAFVTWIAVNASARALAFFAAYALTITALFTACRSLYRLIYNIATENIDFVQVWRDSASTGSWLPYIFVYVLDVPFLLEVLTRALGFYFGCYAIRFMVFRFRFLQSLCGVIFK